MKLKRTLLTIATFALLIGVFPNTSSAQWSLGASYEIRQEEPKNGFGVRLEKGILQKLPVVNLGVRAHFSYFNEENNVNQQGFSYSQDVTNYDYGLAAVGGVSVGLLTPYVGLGLGASTLDVSRDNLPSGSPLEEEQNDSAIYWNGFVGAKVSPIPLVKPFVEYRFEEVGEYDDFNGNIDDSNGRLIFGVSLAF